MTNQSSTVCLQRLALVICFPSCPSLFASLASGGRHEFVPEDLYAEAVQVGKVRVLFFCVLYIVPLCCAGVFIHTGYLD